MFVLPKTRTEKARGKFLFRGKLSKNSLKRTSEHGKSFVIAICAEISLLQFVQWTLSSGDDRASALQLCAANPFKQTLFRLVPDGR